MRTTHHDSEKAKQRGAALMVMLVIIVMGGIALLVGSLSRPGLQIARDQKTTVAIAQAKEALIGHAVTNTDYPLGNLPCPDTDNDGISDAGGSNNCPVYIGRLPWKTLGLPDLRDAAGERLWYTLSRNVRRYSSVRPINSDTAGTLDITGTYTAAGLMAIVFAPGANVGSQRRSESQTAACATTGDTRKESLCAANYLEGSNANPSPGSAPNQDYQSSNVSLPFNDQPVSISRDQLFLAVEKRVGNEIKKILNTYYLAWGSFPFAAPFADPSTSSFTGQAATYNGLLPVGDNVMPTWAGIPTVTFSGGGSYDSCELLDGVVNNSRWRCSNITISAGETITFTGTLNNAGRGLWRPHNVSNICEVRARDSSGTDVLATSVLGNVTVTGKMNSNGSATIVFRAKGKGGYSTLQQVELRDILDYNTDIKSYGNSFPTCPRPPTSPVIPTWLFNNPTAGNNWHQVAHYAVSPDYAPGGDHSCTTSPCLTVSEQDAKQAVVVMTGGALTGQPRPSGNLASYLEQGNLTPADFVYKIKARSSDFNDQVIIVGP